MGTEKRDRQKANRKARLAEAAAEVSKETRERSVKRIGKFVAFGAAIVAVFMLIRFLRGGDDEAPGINFAATPDPEDAAATADAGESDDFEPFSGTGALATVEPPLRNRVYDEAPEMTIDPAGSYTAVLDTDAGIITVELFADEAPLAVNNFVNLARDGFYDGLTFHRVMADFMAQAGDPVGTGTGGPGYSFDDEFTSGREFNKRGLLAMANSGPSTNGSQFFLTLVPTDWLKGLHTIFGEVVGDDSVLDSIVITGEGPATLIRSVTIDES